MELDCKSVSDFVKTACPHLHTRFVRLSAHLHHDAYDEIVQRFILQPQARAFRGLVTLRKRCNGRLQVVPLSVQCNGKSSAVAHDGLEAYDVGMLNGGRKVRLELRCERFQEGSGIYRACWQLRVDELAEKRLDTVMSGSH